MSITGESTQRPTKVSTTPSAGSPDKTSPNNRRLATVAGLIATAVAVAAFLLVDIGASDSNDRAVRSTASRTVAFDPGPPWEPSGSALEELGYGRATTDPETEFAGIPAPQWHPNDGRLAAYLGKEPVTGIR